MRIKWDMALPKRDVQRSNNHSFMSHLMINNLYRLRYVVGNHISERVVLN